MKKLFGFLIVLIFLISCGGGGGGGDGDNSPPKNYATINFNNAAQLGSAIRDTHGFRVLENLLQIDIGSGLYSPRSVLDHAQNSIFGYELYNAEPQSSMQTMGSDTTTEACADSGSVHYYSTWDGPNNPVNCSEVQNPKLRIVFDNCWIGLEKLDGELTIYLPGSDLCSMCPSPMEISTNNLHYLLLKPNTELEVGTTFIDLIINASSIQCNTNGNLKSMNLTGNGQVSSFEEGVNYYLVFNNFGGSYKGMTWNELNELISLIVTVNGNMWGQIGGNDFNESYDNLVYKSQLTTYDSNPVLEVAIDGDYSASCVSGWITVNTLENILFPLSEPCPIGGEVKISGNGSAIFTFDEDGGVNISVNNQDQYYISCEDLPECYQ